VLLDEFLLFSDKRYGTFKTMIHFDFLFAEAITEPDPLHSVITLRAKLSGAVYCYRSCLWRAGGVCLWVCYHDNS